MLAYFIDQIKKALDGLTEEQAEAVYYFIRGMMK